MLKKKPESAKNVASRAPSPRDLEKSAQNFRKVGVSASILAKKLMTNRLAGCVRRSFLKIKISQMQYDRGPTRQKKSSWSAEEFCCTKGRGPTRFREKVRVLRLRSDEVVPANEGSRLRRDRPHEMRASPLALAGASALQARRGRRLTRSLRASRYPRSR